MMAAFQGIYKWIPTFLSALAKESFLVFLPVLTLLQLTSGCHPASRELHICLNIYLERDFPLIETIVKGQGRFGRGRVILEGPDLAYICRDIGNLRDCYGNLLPECDTLWQYDRYLRVMNVLGATHDYFCLNNTNNIRDVLLKSGCLIRARDYISECTGFDWSMSWREVLRMQVSPQDRCPQLESYQRCLYRSLADTECGSDSSQVFQRLFDLWLKHWCGKNSTPEEDRQYFYLSLFTNVSKITSTLNNINDLT